ncbi:MAG: helix-turn-helix transcriptional regulator [Pseudomonadota bacterium]
MKISNLLSDEAILTEIGERMARRRLDLQLTQADVAEQAGIAKRTLERIEAGASAQMSSMIRILRVLELLPGMNQLFPETEARPMEALKHKGRQRQRASSSRASEDHGEPWSWDEDA